MEFHEKELSLRCRVCGRRVSARKNAPVQKYTDELLVIHGIDLREDDIHRHPQLLCGGCVMHMQRATRSESMSRSFAQSLLARQDEWPACSGGSCPLCDHWKKELKGGKDPSQQEDIGLNSWIQCLRPAVSKVPQAVVRSLRQ